MSYTYHTTANSVTPNIGKLRSVTNGAASIFYDAWYDRLGRVSISRQIIGTRELRFSYGYALNDALTGIIYPSGRVLAFSLDDAGRTTGATGGMPGSTAVSYASGATYAPHGALSQMTLTNGLTERWKYTPRLQVSSVHLGTCADGTTAAYNRMGLSYGYAADGSPSAHGIQRAEGTWSQGFSYDAVGRLQSAWETAGPEVWRQSFDYDRWGNRWFNSACVGVATCNHGFFQDPLSASAQGDYNQATNRLTKTGLTEYADGVGNQTKLGELVLTYDEEGRVATSAIGTTSSAYHTSSTYQYDGEGRRVRKVVEKTVNNTTTTDTTVYVYTAHGELAAEYKGEPQDAGPVRYVAVDALGSTRALTDGAGAVTKCYDFLPFGEPVSQGRSGCYAGSDEVRQKFTGQLRDGETSTVVGNDRDALDYFGARYFSAVQGRCTSPDEPLMDQFAGDPQSWNLYSYVRSNPLQLLDPTGRCSQAKDPKDGYVDEGNSLFEGPCSGSTIGDSKNNKNSTTTEDVMPASPLLLAFAEGTRRAQRDISTTATVLGIFASAYASVTLATGVAVQSTLLTLGGRAALVGAAGINLVGTDPQKVRQALLYVARLPGTAQQKAAVLKELFGKIKAGSGGSWEFQSYSGADGSVIFSGPFGNMAVVTAAGQVFKGGPPITNNIITTASGSVLPNYPNLTLVK